MSNTYDKYDTFHAKNKQQIFDIINDKKSIYIWGDYGTGKTHLFRFLQKKWLLSNFIHLKSVEIHRSIRDEISYHKATGEFKTSIRIRMRDTRVLFIDDLGNETMTDFLFECYQEVIGYRYENNMPTFINSNYSIVQLKDMWSKSIGDIKAGMLIARIKTLGIIKIQNDDFRLGEM